MMHRQQIVETLWPDLSPEIGERDFKIAYNALIRVLEPQRSRNDPSSFIVREGSRYGMRQTADLWFDVAEFDRLIMSADHDLSHNPNEAREQYRRALALYQGEYLQDFPYETWATQERTRLLNRYLRTAERLAGSLLRERQWDEAIDVCHALLDHDNCWEPAYQILIHADLKMGNRSQAIRTYKRCEQALSDELGLKPSEATRKLIIQAAGPSLL
jgi:DNA-binding SARP family transcriptional activator